MRRIANFAPWWVATILLSIAAATWPLIALIAGISLVAIIILATRKRHRQGPAEEAVPLLLAVLVAGLFIGGRNFTYIGHTPVFLADILALAFIISGPWLIRASRNTAFLISVVVYLFLGLLSLMTHPFTDLVAQRFYLYWLSGLGLAVSGLSPGSARKLWLWTVNLSSVAAFVTIANVFFAFLQIPEAASGIYLAAYPIHLICEGRYSGPRVRRLLLHLIALLTLAKRGPVVAVVIGLLVTLMLRRVQRTPRVLTVAAALLSFFTAIALVVIAAAPLSTVPIIGPTVVRFTHSLSDSPELQKGHGSEGATANVSWRANLWKTALRRTWEERPLTGFGLGTLTREIDVSADSITDSKRGLHNSFVSLFFYGGAPTLAAFLALLILTVRRAISAWQVSSVAAASGFLIVILVTAGTNVTLEGPYMGMPFWIVLGALWSISISRPPEGRHSRLLARKIPPHSYGARRNSMFRSPEWPSTQDNHDMLLPQPKRNHSGIDSK